MGGVPRGGLRCRHAWGRGGLQAASATDAVEQGRGVVEDVGGNIQEVADQGLLGRGRGLGGGGEAGLGSVGGPARGYAYGN